MEYSVNVSYELKVEADSYSEASSKGLYLILTGAVQPEYVSVYKEREKNE